MACTHTCDCHSEGTRGLSVDGTGVAVDPFNAHPAASRTIPRTVASAGSLPAVDAAEIGQLAYVQDTDLVEVQTASEWRAIGNEWRRTFPDDLDVGAVGSNTYAYTPKRINLTEGFWKVAINGTVKVTIGYINPGDQSGNPPGSFGVESIMPEITISPYDATFGNDLAFVDYFPSNDTFWTWDGTHQYNLGRAVDFRVPFHAENIWSVVAGAPIDVCIRARWLPGGLDGWGSLSLGNQIISALRVADHPFGV